MEFLEWLGGHWTRLVAFVLFSGVLMGGCCYSLKLKYEYVEKRDGMFYDGFNKTVKDGNKKGE